MVNDGFIKLASVQTSPCSPNDVGDIYFYAWQKSLTHYT